MLTRAEAYQDVSRLHLPSISQSVLRRASIWDLPSELPISEGFLRATGKKEPDVIKTL